MTHRSSRLGSMGRFDWGEKNLSRMVVRDKVLLPCRGLDGAIMLRKSLVSYTFMSSIGSD